MTDFHCGVYYCAVKRPLCGCFAAMLLRWRSGPVAFPVGWLSSAWHSFSVHGRASLDGTVRRKLKGRGDTLVESGSVDVICTWRVTERPKSLGSSSGLERTHSPLEAVVERGDLFWSLFWISDFWHCYPVAQTSRRSSLGKWQLLITVGSSRVLEGPLVHLVSVETHVGTAERSRRSSWCTSEKSIECFFWTSAAVREYFHREKTPQRKVRSSSSSLCLDYVDEGVPHLHASHSGGGRGSFIDFCEPQSCRSASFSCFALLHLFYCKSDRRSILGKFTIFCTKASYKQELESGSHRGVELLFVSPSTQLVCVQQQQRESCD